MGTIISTSTVFPYLGLCSPIQLESISEIHEELAVGKKSMTQNALIKLGRCCLHVTNSLDAAVWPTRINGESWAFERYLHITIRIRKSWMCAILPHLPCVLFMCSLLPISASNCDPSLHIPCKHSFSAQDCCRHLPTHISSDHGC